MLQVQQNNAARHITRLPFYTSTKTLLNQCNWLSISQLVMFHSLVLFQKVLKSGKPGYLFKKVRYVSQETRTMDKLSVFDCRTFETETASRGTIKQWNSVPYVLITQIVLSVN